MKDLTARTRAEGQRIRAAYDRRARVIDEDHYAAWQPVEILYRQERLRLAAASLRKLKAFPKRGDRCLEIGCGNLGWLADMLNWGLREPDLHGIDLHEARTQSAQETLPTADLRIGDASELPWPNEAFQLVIASTVFSSIQDAQVRRLVADEVVRVLAPGGAFLLYDIAVDNPGNPDITKVKRREIRSLFPTLSGPIGFLTLAPPLARQLVKRSWLLTTLASAIPLLQTHLMATLIKPLAAETASVDDPTQISRVDSSVACDARDLPILDPTGRSGCQAF